MADFNDRYPENARGKFFVDRACIACISCVTVAPKHFQMVNGNEHSSVVLQPTNEKELGDCMEAMRVCPVNAIGDNADEPVAAPVLEPSVFKHRILESILLHANRTALVQPSDGRELSYRDLGEHLDKVAGLLQKHAIRPGDVVSIVSENSVEMAALLLGCMAYGAVAMPVNPKLSPSEMQTLLDHSGSRLLVADRPLVLERGGLPLVHTWEYRELEAADRAQWAAHPVAAESGALLIYTSGTTGKPKGVLLNHGNLASNVDVAIRAFGLDADHHKLCVLPLFHTFGVISDLSTALFTGACCVVLETFDVTRLAQIPQALKRHKVRSFSAVPLIFDLLVRLGADLKGGELQFCVSGAAPLSARVARAFKEAYGVPIIPAYGLTETTCFATISPLDGIVEGSAGKPAGLEVKILGEDGRELRAGWAGEVVVRGPSVMAGSYFKDGRDAFVQGHPGWFPTGDLGTLDEEGYLRITGRIKNMVIRGGEKIFLEDVDSCLLEMPGVEDCASVRLDGRDSEKFATVVVKGGLSTLEAADVQKFLRERISPQKCPDFVLFRAEIPRSATHKVKLAELLARALERI